MTRARPLPNSQNRHLMSALLGYTLMLVAAVLVVLFAASISGCASQRSADTLADVAALVVLEDAYQDAKETLIDRLDDFPEETAFALLALEEETDQLVIDYRTAWANPQSVDEVLTLIQRTGVLYDQGKELVTPHLGEMSLAEQQRLRRLDTAWGRVLAAYERWQNDPDAAQRRQMATAGLELAAALLLAL